MLGFGSSAFRIDCICAWAEVGTGKMSEAQADFDAIIKTPGMGAFGTYHKALALASTGAEANETPITPRRVMMAIRRPNQAPAEI